MWWAGELCNVLMQNPPLLLFVDGGVAARGREDRRGMDGRGNIGWGAEEREREKKKWGIGLVGVGRQYQGGYCCNDLGALNHATHIPYYCLGRQREVVWRWHYRNIGRLG